MLKSSEILSHILGVEEATKAFLKWKTVKLSMIQSEQEKKDKKPPFYKHIKVRKNNYFNVGYYMFFISIIMFKSWMYCWRYNLC